MQDNKVMLDWLHQCKVTDFIIKEFDIHWGTHPIIGECIVIPIKTADGSFSYNKYRRNPLSDDKPKYLYDKGGKLTLFGMFKAKSEKRILITEGEKDALVAWSANIPAVSGTGGAMSFNPDWASLFAGKEVVVCFDNDSAGGAGMAKVLEILPWAKILFLPDRPGVKDISDYVMNGGDLNALLATAKSFTSLEEVISDRSERLATWKSTFFHDAYIKNHTKPTFTPRKKSDELSNDIERAHSYPIPELLRFNADGKSICPFHKERTGSLHYYPANNSCYCFGGCGRKYDAIDIYMKISGVGFKEAVKALQ